MYVTFFVILLLCAIGSNSKKYLILGNGVYIDVQAARR